MRCQTIILVVALLASIAAGHLDPKPANAQAMGEKGGQSIDQLPPYITQLTHFGERADWSHDGKRVLFLEKTFGDVFEVDVASKLIRPVTHHYFHEGYTRALYLSDGQILLSGASEFSAADPWPSRSKTAELWLLDKDRKSKPVALGERCSEGPAVSRTRLHLAWTVTHDQYPDRLPAGVSQIWTADIAHDGAGKPSLVNKKLVLDSRKLPFRCTLECQSFRPPREKELTFSAYNYQGTEVMGLDLETGNVVNYSNAPAQYDEPEGIFPDGRHTLVECDRHRPSGSQNIDIYKLALDGSGKTERLTFFNQSGKYKASNPVVSDDGHFMAFQYAIVGEPAGVGHGILVFDLDKAKQ